jgi:hypothetical protein
MKVKDDVTVVLGAKIDQLIHHALIAIGIKEPPVLAQGQADKIAFPGRDGLAHRGEDPVWVAIIDPILKTVDVHAP